MVISKSSATDTDILALSEPLKPEVHETEMPDLTRVINETSLTSVWINLEKLNDLYLEIKIEAFSTFLRSEFFWDCSQISNIFSRKHLVFREVSLAPFT